MGALPGEITGLLAEVRNGNRDAEARLVPLVYAELRRLAARYIRNERRDHTLQATALVHEAYIRLIGKREIDWQNRAHFFAVACEVMRRILVDYARSRRAGKRGGPRQRIPIEEVAIFSEARSEELLAVDEALQRLARRDPRQSRVVELRFFAGLTVEETAEVLGMSPKTVKRDWSVARAWLHGELAKGATA